MQRKQFITFLDVPFATSSSSTHRVVHYGSNEYIVGVLEALLALYRNMSWLRKFILCAIMLLSNESYVEQHMK
jgi:hypothetical protein